MPCCRPLKAFPSGITSSGKVKYKIVPFSVGSLDQFGNPVPDYVGHGDNDTSSHFVIPCGHCLGCRIDQANEWSNRLVMEMQYHDSSYFLTLTYDDFHLNRVPYCDKLTGELKDDRGTLCKRDVQLFIKRLRKSKPSDSIRYYLCGEYGPTTDRPHYHAIIFGLHIGNWSLIESGVSETGNVYYTCPELESIWQNGFVSIEPANEFTCKYVCQYVTKKIGIKPNQYRLDRGQVPEFSLMSRKPGIGRLFYDEYGVELFDKGVKFIGTFDGSVRVTPPRYFKKLYSVDHEDEYRKIVDQHLIAADDSDDAISSVTDLSKIDRLRVSEDNLRASLNFRDGI